MPDEIYNLAAQSHVAVSFKNPIYSTFTSTIGPITILESIRNVDKDIKFYQASSSEMFGGSEKIVLNEDSLFEPKALRYWKSIRSQYNKSLQRVLQYFCSKWYSF